MQLLKMARHLFQPRAIVLMYHRIADAVHDPWQLSVSLGNFEQHLQVLQKSKVIPVQQLAYDLQKKSVVHNSVCLTFDDGYADNYLRAKPLLEKYQSPATFFIPTEYLGQQAFFWWDELEDIFLGYPELPAELSVSIRGSTFEFNLGEDKTLSNEQAHQHTRWTWPAEAPTLRCKLYLSLWEKLKPLPYGELKAVIGKIKSWASFKEPVDKESYPMTLEQLADLSPHSFITLGLHTVTHLSLSHHPSEIQLAEIAQNKLYLEKICPYTVNCIAYPYGDYNTDTLTVSKQLKLSAAFTTTERIVSNLSDPLQVGRFQVRNWTGDQFKEQLTRWSNSSQFL